MEAAEASVDRFRRLLAPHHDRVLAFARSLSRLTAEGDDLFQEAALFAFTKLHTLRDDGAFRTWLFRIILDHHRSRSRRVFWRRLIPFSALATDDTLTDELYRTEGWSPGAAEANRRARNALAKLPAQVREAIVMFEIEGFDVQEIAALQGTGVSAIKSRLARGRARLRALYDDQPALTSAVTQGDPT